MRRSKEQIRDLFRAARAKLGDDIGQAQFCSATGVKLSEITYHFGDVGTLREEEGLPRNELRLRLSDEEVFGDYARACLHLGKVPSAGWLRIVQRELKTRTNSVYDREPGGIHAFQEKFRSWLSTSDDSLKVILNYTGWARKRSGDKRECATDTVKPQPHLHQFLPACLQYLDVLARGELPPFESPTLSVSTLFERRAADAFRCLGFEIHQLGQGSGRNADALACSPRERVALIIDAKVRVNGYVLGTEDRKFLDYAVMHSKDRQKKGFEQLYFVVVAPSFREPDLKRLAEYLSSTPIRSIAMITARALMRMVEGSIRNRSEFSLADFAREIFGNKIISS